MSSLVPRPGLSIPPTPHPESRAFAGGLLPDLRAMLSPRDLGRDLVAGLMVASTALPISLAIALASDVAPIVGVITAVVAGIVAALFGGARVSVTGPAVVLAVLVGQIVDAHGLGGLAFVGIVAGLLQVVTGVLGLGSLLRLVPLGVIHGFTAGIGVLLLVGQLPRALGLSAPDESHVVDALVHVGTYLHDANLVAVAMAALCFGVALVVQPRMPRVPATLLAVGACTAAVVLAPIDVPRIGPLVLEVMHFSVAIPSSSTTPALLGDALVVYAIASLQAVIAMAALDRARGGEPTNVDQEIIGQGLANVASSLVSGIPVTNVLVRSKLANDAGGRTRRTAIVQSLVVLAVAAGLAPFFAYVPIPALVGVMLAAATQMLGIAYVRTLWNGSRVEAAVFLVTVATMVAFDLFAGVQAGCVVALVLTLLRLGTARVRVHVADDDGPHHVTMSGALTFIAITKLDRLAAELDGLPRRDVVLDVGHLAAIDASAAERLVDLVQRIEQRGARVAILGTTADVRERLLAFGDRAFIESRLATRQADVDRIFERATGTALARRRLLAGVERFRSEIREPLSGLLGELAVGQHPHTLMIACSDSRVVPTLLTGTQPGELFVVRNIGALLPPSGEDDAPSEGAAVEYAVHVLGVRNIIVCAHASCGAMTAIKTGKLPPGLPALASWAKRCAHVEARVRGCASVNDAAREAAIMQLEHLRTYDVVRDRERTGELTLAAWYYDVERADIEEYRPDYGRYVPLGSELRRETRTVEVIAPPAPERVQDEAVPQDPAA